jgi:NAD(P)-dependent dehydrogenase (short-subunit alcohol dehydrogenase family)
MGEARGIGGRSFTTQVAVVTGASSGIGRAVAQRLAGEGARVALFARNRERLEESAATIRRTGAAEVLPLCGDVTSEADVARLAEETLRLFGAIDMLVAAAGIGRAPGAAALLPRPLSQLPAEQWDIVLRTNLTGIFLCNRAVLPAMVARGGGDIVNISSARAGLRGESFASAYCASKFGVIGLSQALRDEVAPFGIRVSVVLPDATATPMIDSGAGASRFGPTMPADRVADAILHLIGQQRDSVLCETVILPWQIDAGG